MSGQSSDPKGDELIEVVRTTVLDLESIVERLESFVNNMEDTQGERHQ